MKKKEFKKKLSLNKQTVSELNKNEMLNLKGGSIGCGWGDVGPSVGCPSNGCPPDTEYCNGTSPCTTAASGGYEDWTNQYFCS